jgi:hypothetical protein
MRASLGARFCMIDSCAGLFGSSEPMMREGHKAEAVMSYGPIRKAGNGFPKGSDPQKNVQQQSGSLGKTGKVPVTYTKGWTPS